jgi:putative ABC transport system permease protein
MAIPLSYSIRSVAVRRGSSAMAIGGIALVVIVFIALLALAAGFERAVATSGSPDNIIIIRKGSDAELQSQVTREQIKIINGMDFVAKDAAGKPLALSETVIILSRRKTDGGSTNVAVRGTYEDAQKVHSEVKVKEGRWFKSGSNEAIIGAGLARRIENFTLGQSISAGQVDWKIVGVFEAAGSGLESEVWIDVELMQNVFNRQNTFQSMLFRTSKDSKLAEQELRALIDADPRLQSLEAQTEKAYYTKQSKLMAGVIMALGNILTLIMAVGAIAGAMNTMYAAVSQRKREIGCMLAMGFSPEAVWMAFILESLVLSLIGAGIGCVLSLVFNGMKTGAANWATFSETAFEFTITPGIALMATVLALVMGFIGGFLPALQAARMKVVDALRRS